MTSKRPGRRWTSIGALVALATVGAACGGGDDTKTVTAADYSFRDLPKEVDAGTTLTLKNSSTKELHEMVVMRLADDEKRPVAQLVNLPEAEGEKVFAGRPAMVLIAPPNGGETIKAVGDGKLMEKGRYAVICSIPIGADPAAFLAAMQSSQGGPPNVPGGPPHLTQGMFGEITVK
ncbi:MAG: hypothetical protein AVDCRST_MAG10-2589 [uncultured Acidimicrobiales bacterium]|uniref:EfeO-type cupredoxin-like domain-containing protein n=1 Tax=uncultured Acidimicrobiales bacterium TaxID=310071 RepID=A0A6J4IPA0_9ACTN|nr:MAG: hypothetical protein AVDCRST_MAG10-2589 [uncultured Acidimicrobiales bacterium]